MSGDIPSLPHSHNGVIGSLYTDYLEWNTNPSAQPDWTAAGLIYALSGQSFTWQ